MPNNGRSRLREKAVVELLQKPTLQKAAEATGVGLRTLQRWLTEPSFQEALRAAKSSALSDATAKLRTAASAMVRVLVAIARNTRANSASRVSAARTVLELGIDAHVLEEIETRILALERQGKDHATFRID